MTIIEWNQEKNEQLKKQRKVCFEDITKALSNNSFLDITDHYNKNRYPTQKILMVEISNYVYMVPFVEDNEKIFLKTIIPSRKMTKRYLNK